MVVVAAVKAIEIEEVVFAEIEMPVGVPAGVTARAIEAGKSEIKRLKETMRTGRSRARDWSCMRDFTLQPIISNPVENAGMGTGGATTRALELTYL